MSYKHYVITSRPLAPLPGTSQYSYRLKEEIRDATSYLRCGRYTVSEKGIAALPLFNALKDCPEWLHYAPGETIPDVLCVPGAETDAFFTEIFTEMKTKGNKALYVYLFGFGNTIRRELEKHIANMHKSYFINTAGSAVIGNLVFLTWPSQGGYNKQKEDVKSMGRALAVLFLKMHHFIYKSGNPLFSDWEPKIVLHAQSMGCRIVQEMVMNLNYWNRTEIKNFFHRLVFTGGDVDDSLLNKTDTLPLPDAPVTSIVSIAKRVVLVYNPGDFTLGISEILFGNSNRLGNSTPAKEDLPLNVDPIKAKGIFAHAGFLRKTKLIGMILNAIQDKLPSGNPDITERELVVYNANSDEYTVEKLV